MNNESIVMNVCNSIDQFLTSLRTAQGFKKDEFDQLCAALRNAETAFKPDNVIPKQLAYYLVELEFLMAPCATPYKGEERKLIDKAIVILDELVRNVVAIDQV